MVNKYTKNDEMSYHSSDTKCGYLISQSGSLSVGFGLSEGNPCSLLKVIILLL